MKYKISFLLLAVIILAAGCGKNVELQTKPFEIQTLTIYPENQMMAINSTLQFYAISISKGGISQKVAADWEADNRSYDFGTFEANGLFHSSGKSGATTIQATYGSFIASTMIGITPGGLASLQISPEAATLGEGDYYTFNLYARDTYGNSVSVSPTWRLEGSIGNIVSQSSNHASVSVNLAGTGYLKAVSGSLEATANITVIDIVPYNYDLYWKTKAGTLEADPKGVAVGPDGNIWATMYIYSSGSYEGYVNKYDSSGNFLLSLEAYATSEGRLQVPNDLAFDSGGNIYIVDYYTDKVRKYDNGGNFVLAWGGSGSTVGKFNYPARIAIDKNNYIYITDYENDRVQKFDTSGNFILEWGEYGQENGQFRSPTGIAADSQNNIYVADKYNYRIQKFNSSGSYLGSWGKEGTTLDEFGQLVGITVDSADKLFLADQSGERVHKYDNQGNFITRWGSYGTEAGKFDGPTDVAVDSAGNVYVVDYYNKRIQKFKP